MSVPKRTDQEYLLNEQYKSASNLRARIQLHRQYSTNTYGWTRWVFDYLALVPKSAQLLELGCGPCDLWLANLQRIPPNWEIVLSDLSPGMLETAQNLLVDRAERFTFQEFDAQSIPFDDDSFDGVIANHMLYHLPDLNKGLAEIKRVLKPGGKLFAATNGARHLVQIEELHAKFLQTQQISLDESTSKDADGGENENDAEVEIEASGFHRTFSLDNGEEILSKYFSPVSLRRYVDALHVTSTSPLFAYMMSSQMYGVDAALHQALSTFLEDELAAASGMLVIEKETGLFQATA